MNRTFFWLIVTICLSVFNPVFADQIDTSKEYILIHNDAINGNPEAQFLYGRMLYEGTEVQQDYGKAKEWFEKSALQGNQNAKYNLAVMYTIGQGVMRDTNKALELFRESALSGNSLAYYILEFVYYDGKTFRKDFTKGVEFIERNYIY